MDEGIEFSATLEGSAYPLKEMSTRRAITEDGEPVYVTSDGNRVQFPIMARRFHKPNSGWDSRLVGGYVQGDTAPAPPTARVRAMSALRKLKSSVT